MLSARGRCSRGCNLCRDLPRHRSQRRDYRSSRSKFANDRDNSGFSDTGADRQDPPNPQRVRKKSDRTGLGDCRTRRAHGFGGGLPSATHPLVEPTTSPDSAERLGLSYDEVQEIVLGQRENG